MAPGNCDACRNNPFRSRMLRSADRRSVGRGLASIEPGGNVLVAYAAKHGVFALDGKGNNSPYAEALLENIEKPGLEIAQLFREVRDTVLEKTGNEQEPHLYGSLGREQLFFKKAREPVPEPSPPEPAPFDPVQVELQWWERVKDGADAALLAEFLQRYPQGVFAPLARGKLAELEWSGLKASRSATDIEAFLQRWPGSRFEAVARARLAALRRKEERQPLRLPWKAVAAAIGLSIAAGGGYLLLPGAPTPVSAPVTPPAPPPAEEPAHAADDKAYTAAERRRTKAAFEDYLDRYPQGRHAAEARAELGKLETAAFEDAGRTGTAEAYRRFQKAWPDGEHFALAGQRIDSLAKAKADAERRAADEVAASSGQIAVRVGLPGKEETRRFTPGNGKTESFRDCPDCPEMVVAPDGKFTMGSPDNEKDRSSDEGPPHKVTIPKPFAAGRFAVTREEYEAFVKDTGRAIPDKCRIWDGSSWTEAAGRSFRNPGFEQTGRHPVVCVNWNDAQAYAAWLSKKTGKEYRLLSEAEREYVARADTATPFWWGPSISTDQANYDGNYTYGGGSKGEYRKATVPVDRFKANPWGLYQVHGNVWEWVEDCWNASYEGKPLALRSNGGAWTTGDCSSHVLRGGSWSNDPWFLRAAYRGRFSADVRLDIAGFRLARTLTP
jgi:formylglycine-generating enzyme required for sulfatase activity